MNFRVISLFLAVLFTEILVGQMTLHPGNTPPLTSDNIVENVFLGNGIEILQTRFAGAQSSIGLFDNAQNEIGLNKGIVLSTGYVRNVNRENTSNTPISSNTTGNTYKDTDLEGIAGVEVVDIVKFDITFIPSSDLVSFRYVFASEEYPDFVCADKNDVFGFFISGKKPGGGNYDSENIAVVPDPNNAGAFLDLPVSINSVNGGEPGNFSNGNCSEQNESLDYSQYYNEVSEGSSPALNAYLDVFVAQAAVIPCETYTIKIALGDGNDQNEDSVVFLEERSFSTGTLTVDINNPGIDGGIAEGCDDGSLRLHLPEAVEKDFPIELEILSGPEFIDAAIPGVDFMDVPNNLFIPAGESYLDLDLQPIDDNVDEGTEFIYIKVRKSICNVDTLILPLFNNNLESVELPDTIFTCKSKTFELIADLGDNVNPSSMLIFENKKKKEISSSENHTESLIEVFGLKDISLTPSIIAEVCIDSLVHPRLNDLDIYLRAPSNQVLELTTDNGNRSDNDDQPDAFIRTCFSISASQNINYGNPSEGDQDSSNRTYTGSFLPEGSFDEWLSPITSTLNGEYGLFIVDDKKEYDGELYSWHIAFNPKYELDYVWSPAEDLECSGCEIAEGTGEDSKYYYMELTDSYGCTYVDSVWVEVSEQAEAPIIDCETPMIGSISYSWQPSPHADYYEYSIIGSEEWHTTEQLEEEEIGVYGIEVISATSLIVTGLLDQETMTLEVRANNAAGCQSESAFSTCTTIDCNGTLPVINEVKIDQPICASETRVIVEVEAESSAMPLTYRIDLITTSSTNDDGFFYAIPQGTWSVRIIDSNGCAIEEEVTVNTPDPIELNEIVKPITCADDADASITLDASGAFPPFQYEWNNGNTESERKDLGPNFYTVTVTDSQGCTAVEDFHIINPEPLTAEYNQSDILDCSASNDVSASLDINGGYAPYGILWNGISTDETLTSLRPGTLEYTVTDDEGCKISATEEVEQVDGLVIEFSNQTELSCFDSADGTLITNVSNGEAPYSFIWENGETNSNPIALTAGLNSVTVTDKNGCEASSQVDIIAPEEIEIKETSTGPSCHDETDAEITIDLPNSIGTEEFLWSDGSTSDNRNELAPGTYCVTVTNENGCTAKKCIEILAPEKLDATYILSKVGCDNATLGIIDLTPTGGSGEYLYNWKGPDGYASSEEDLTGLEIGTYSLILSDKNNPRCSTPIELAVQCHGDSNASLQASASGGAEPYTYQWSQNGNNDSISNLNAGSYTVTVTDLLLL